MLLYMLLDTSTDNSVYFLTIKSTLNSLFFDIVNYWCLIHEGHFALHSKLYKSSHPCLTCKTQEDNYIYKAIVESSESSHTYLPSWDHSRGRDVDPCGWYTIPESSQQSVPVGSTSLSACEASLGISCNPRMAE